MWSNLSLMKPTTLFGTIALTLACGSYAVSAQTPATNSEVREIRREMEQLRQDYERRMQSLEERLKRVEVPPLAAGTNAVPPAASPTPAPLAVAVAAAAPESGTNAIAARQAVDRKSTRLNSSH